MPADVSITTQLLGATEAVQGLTSIERAIDGLGGTSQTVSQRLTDFGSSMTRVGAGVSLATTPLALFAASAIRTSADFEAAMTRIQVTSGATAEDMVKVAEAAQEIGSRTTFSASDAADALLALTRNGIELKDSLGGALDAAVELAAATGTDLGFAADTASRAMQQFHATAEELPRMMEQLYNGTNASTFQIQDFALALGQAGGVAGNVGVDFDEFTTALTATSAAFFSGSDAGTSFKVFLSNLVPSTKQAADMMASLGLNFFDANNKMLPMRDIVGQLSTAFAGMSEEQRINSAQTMFGTDAMRTALVLASGGVATWDAYARKIAETGNMHAAAAAMMSGFWGAIEQLRGSLENLFLTIGRSGLLDWATEMVRAFSGVIDQLAQADPAFVRMAVVVAGVAVAIGPVLVTLGAVTLALGAVLTPLGGVVAALAVAGVAFLAFAGDIGRAVTDVVHWMAGLAASWDGTIGGLVGVLATAAAGVGGVLTGMLTTLAQWGGQFATTALEWMQNAGAVLVAEVASWDLGAGLNSLLTLVAGWASDFATSVGAAAAQAGDWLLEEVAGWDLGGGLGALLTAVAEWAGDFVVSVGEAAVQAGQWLVDTVASWDIAQGLGALLTSVAEWATDFATSVGEAAVQAGAWLIDEVSSWDLSAGLDELLTMVAEWAGDFATSVGEAAAQAGEWLLEEVSGWDLASGLDTLLSVVAGWASDFATSVGEAAAQAGEWLVDEVGAWDIAGALGELLVTVAEWAGDFATSIGQSAAQAGEWLVDAIGEWAPDLGGALGYVIGYALGKFVEFGVGLVRMAGEAIGDLADAWEHGLSGIDWTGAVYAAVGAISEALFSLVEIAADIVVEFGRGFLEGLGDALGVDAVAVVEDGVDAIYVAITTGLGNAYDGAVSIVESMADSVVEWIGGIPSRLLGLLGSIKDAIVQPFAEADDEVRGHSIVPEMVDAVVGLIAALPGKLAGPMEDTRKALVTPMEAAQEQATTLSDAIADKIAHADWGIDEKATQFAALRDTLVATGQQGKDALEALDATIDATFNAELTRILDDTSLTLQGQTVAVENLLSTYEGMDERALSPTERMRDALETMRDAAEAAADVMDQQVNAVLHDTGLLMTEQVAQLEAIIAENERLGQVAPEELDKVREHVAGLNEEIARQNDVLAGVNEALVENVEAWGGWGEAAHDVVAGFSDGAKDVLADFFETGKLDIEDLGNTFKRVLAEEAAEAVVAFASNGIREILGFATETNTAVGTIGNQFTAMTTSSAGTWTQWLTGLGSSFSGFATQMGTWVSGLGTWFTGLFNSTEGSWTDWLGELGTSFTGLFGDEGGLSGMVSGVSTFFAGMFDTTGGDWTSWLGDLGGMFSGLFGEGGGLSGMLTTASTFFSGFFDTGEGGMSGMLTSMLSGLGGLFGGGGDLSGLLTTASSLFGTFFGEGSGGMGGMLGTMASGLTSLFGGGGTLSGLMGIAGNLLGTFFTSGTAGGTGMIGQLTGMFSGLFGAGGTLGGLFSGASGMFAALFANPVAAAGVGVAAALGVAFVAFGGEFGDLMGNIKNVALAAWDGIKTAFGAALDVMKGVFQAFAGVLTGLFNVIKTVATTVFEGIKATFGAVIAAMEAIFRAFAGVLGALFAAIKAAATAVFEAIRAAFGVLMAIMEGLLRAFAAVAGGVFAGILNVAKLAFTGIAGAAGAAVNVMGNGLTTFAHGAAAVFGAVLSVGTAAFQRLAAFANDAIGGILHALQGLMGTLSGAMAFAGNIFSQILGMANNLADAIRNLFGGVADTISRVFGGLTGGLPKTILNWIGTIGDDLGLGDIKDLLKGIGGFLEHIPGLDDLVDGLSDIFDNIGDIFDDIFDFFHTGGKVGGSGDVPIMAKAGEWVINPESSKRYDRLLGAINSGEFDKTVAGIQEQASGHELPFKAFATGGDAILTSPTLMLGGERGPEMASFRPLTGGVQQDQRPIVFNGPVVTDQMTMDAFARDFTRRVNKVRRRQGF